MSSPYIMMPGGRLYIGPHGQPEESLGSCCGPCATGASRCGAGSAPGVRAVGSVGDAAKPLALLGLAAVGVAVVFPRVWKRFTKSLWG